jgi:hypothetical protein
VTLSAAPHDSDHGMRSASMTRKHDIKQFRQACREAGLTVEERYKASEALHAEKESS